MVKFTNDEAVFSRANIQEVPFAKEFEFRAENVTMEGAKREICNTLRY